MEVAVYPDEKDWRKRTTTKSPLMLLCLGRQQSCVSATGELDAALASILPLTLHHLVVAH